MVLGCLPGAWGFGEKCPPPSYLLEIMASDRSPHTDSGLGHRTCFCQWDFIKHGTEAGVWPVACRPHAAQMAMNVAQQKTVNLLKTL